MPVSALRVFISYPRGGAAHTWAEAVQAHLRREGARAWRDETGVQPGDLDWYRKIESELHAAEVLVAVIGRDSEVCRWQKRELLAADGLGKPIIALRIDAKATMPFVLAEKQPVEAGPDRQATLTALVEALARAAGMIIGRPAADVPDGGIPPDQREAEREWLDRQVNRELAAHADIYVPLEGVERTSTTAERVLPKVRIDTPSIFKAFGVTEALLPAGEPKLYADAVDAYRSLTGRKVRRLAVLGEPGAGKSFSLERIAVAYAESAGRDARAPIPLLVPLGLWTRDDECLDAFITRHLERLGRYLPALIEQHRAVLLLDAINEIPPGQRRHKADQILDLARDERLASVVVSCREKDFAEFSLPFDTLMLQPLSPPRVRDFLHRYAKLQRPDDEAGRAEAAGIAEARFWHIAGGAEVRDAWEAWHRAGAGELFWTADDIPRRDPDVYADTSWKQDDAWRRARFNTRSLLRLAANPYLLYIMAQLPDLPDNRAQLFQGFLDVLYERERKARDDRHDPHVPARDSWLANLTHLAEALQRLTPADQDEDDGARTALPLADCPAGMEQMLIDFSRDASVLDLQGGELRFTHQLLQEYLASRLLLEASVGTRPATDFWPPARWWERNGWEVVAEIAAESCAGDVAAQHRLIAWLAEANPELAEQVWRHAGAPALSAAALAQISAHWMPLMTDLARQPQARARAAIGRALGRLGLDRRPGVGLRADGLPDIDWVTIRGGQPFVYQDGRHPGLPTFQIARYPVTNAQFQAFIDAGGYADERWWRGLARSIVEPFFPSWDEPNSPRESVCWYEAIAYCRWLSDAMAVRISLPTEEQWERTARGCGGREFPWGALEPDCMNCRVHSDDDGEADVGRTTAVGIFPRGATPMPEGVLDLSGNTWEWCMNEYLDPSRIGCGGNDYRVLRGGSWNFTPGCCGATYRFRELPVSRDVQFEGGQIGFRVCRSHFRISER